MTFGYQFCFIRLHRLHDVFILGNQTLKTDTRDFFRNKVYPDNNVFLSLKKEHNRIVLVSERTSFTVNALLETILRCNLKLNTKVTVQLVKHLSFIH